MSPGGRTTIRKLITGLLGLALGAAALGGVLALRRVQIPTLPWQAEEPPAPRSWPLLLESPRRAAVDLKLGWRGGIIQGENWLASRPSSLLKPWSMEHWAAREPSFYFLAAGGEQLELVLALGPRRGEGESEFLQPLLNGNELPQQLLAPSASELVVELPEQLLQRGINCVRLVFAQAAVDDAAGAMHPEQGVASFSSISLRRPGIEASRVGSERLWLHCGSPVALPWSAAAPAQLVLRARSFPAGARLQASCSAPGEAAPELLWEGALSAGEELAVPLPHAPLATLWLHLLEPKRGSAELGYHWVETQAPPRSSVGEGPPHVFLYVVDTLRADAIRGREEGASHTPHFAAFARDAVAFERAWSPSSWTKLSTRALLTGVYPQQPSRAADGTAWWLAKFLARSGYDTLAVSQSFVVSERRFGRGFARYYTSDALSRLTNEGQMPAWFLWHHLVGRAHRERPLFAYLHTIDPHGPYTPYDEDRRQVPWWTAWWPRSYGPVVVEQEGRQSDERDLEIMRALYSGDVRHADRSFGSFIALLKFAGLYEDSVVILLSDHGEAFAEHGTVGHGKTLYEEVLRVPLMVKLPGYEGAGTIVTRRTSTVSVAPTVLELAGLAPPDHLAGPSLLAAAAELSPVRAHLTRKTLVLDTVAAGELKCITSLTATGGRQLELYDLNADPLEQHPLQDPALRSRCLELLEPVLEVAPGAETVPLESEETRRRLEVLGYIDNV